MGQLFSMIWSSFAGPGESFNADNVAGNQGYQAASLKGISCEYNWECEDGSRTLQCDEDNKCRGKGESGWGCYDEWDCRYEFNHCVQGTYGLACSSPPTPQPTPPPKIARWGTCARFGGDSQCQTGLICTMCSRKGAAKCVNLDLRDLDHC